MPAFTTISDGVLPTYLPSRLISAPDGVELKLHSTLSGRTPGAETTGGTGAGAGELAGEVRGAGAACGWESAAALEWGAATAATN